MKPNIIYVSEYKKLKADRIYNGVEFKLKHVDALAKYHVENPGCPYFTPSYKEIHFKNYVGVIKVGDITIEVLPKVDNYYLDDSKWQTVLLKMLAISLQVDAKSTTSANIHLRQHRVLDAYLTIFLDEIEQLIHTGLVKKYRTHYSNQTACRGKLLVHQQVTRNAIHAERFYVAHTVYDRNHVFNAILGQCLECIALINPSISVKQRSEAIRLFFPEFDRVAISQTLFSRLKYDRKTHRYRRAMELARVILLNYHPDIKSGRQDMLAIMFDMNLLWEKYIFYVLKKAARQQTDISIQQQNSKRYWRHENGWHLKLRPDIIISSPDKTVVLDTKWKFNKKLDIQDVRQMYAYGHYYSAMSNYLLFPYKPSNEDSVRIEGGSFVSTVSPKELSDTQCGLAFADLLQDGELNMDIGLDILRKVGFIQSLLANSVS